MSGNANINEKYVWNLIFNNFDSAENYANDWNLLQERNGLNKNIVFAKFLQKQDFYLKCATKSFLPRATSLFDVVKDLNNFSVIEFGGGSGWLPVILLRESQSKISSYLVIETKEVIEHFARSQEYDERLKWWDLESFNGFCTTPSILYSNSVLQYFEDNNIFVNLIKTCNPEIIVIDDLLLVPHHESFTLQNYYGFLIVNRLQSESNVKTQIESLGYRLIQYKDYSSNISNHMLSGIWLNEASVLKEPEHKSMVFARNPEISLEN